MARKANPVVRVPAELHPSPRPMSVRLGDALRRARRHSPQQRAEILARAGLIPEEEIPEVAARLEAHQRQRRR
jgi:hypothetical protein